jgi:hypothetical protein
MIPMVFAGMGGGNFANESMEWAKHYMDQEHCAHQQQLQHQQFLRWQYVYIFAGIVSALPVFQCGGWSRPQ